jgi:NTE family protein
VLIGDEHFLDGGLVNSIPVGRAVSLGARRVFVLQVGRVDRPLTAPTKPWQVASVAFEIARRHRFAREMSEVPEGVEVHVLPTGADQPPRPADLSALRYRDFSSVPLRIAQAHSATREYLAQVLEPRTG